VPLHLGQGAELSLGDVRPLLLSFLAVTLGVVGHLLRDSEGRIVGIKVVLFVMWRGSMVPKAAPYVAQEEKLLRRPASFSPRHHARIEPRHLGTPSTRARRHDSARGRPDGEQLVTPLPSIWGRQHTGCSRRCALMRCGGESAPI
jgi:hypothetical protein